MTTTAQRTIRSVLVSANPNEVADALRKIKFGNMLEPIKVVVAALTANATPDITSAAVRAAATVTGGLGPTASERLPAIASIVSLRVVASGTAASLGVYGIGDASATAIIPPGGAGAALGVALLSDDGKTITFPNTVTAFTIVYMPRPYVDLDTVWAPST